MTQVNCDRFISQPLLTQLALPVPVQAGLRVGQAARSSAVPARGEGGSGGFLSECSCQQIESCRSVRVAKEASVGTRVLRSATQGSLHLAPLDAVPELNGVLGGTSVGATPKRVLHVTPPASFRRRDTWPGSAGSPASSLVEMSWGSGQQKVLRATAGPPGATCTSTAGLPQSQEHTEALSKPKV